MKKIKNIQEILNYTAMFAVMVLIVVVSYKYHDSTEYKERVVKEFCGTNQNCYCKIRPVKVFGDEETWRKALDCMSKNDVDCLIKQQGEAMKQTNLFVYSAFVEKCKKGEI